MFWQAWALPGGIRQDPPGSWGYTLQPLTAERGFWLCPSHAEGIHGPRGGHRHLIHTSVPPVHWNWEGAQEPFIYWLCFWREVTGWFSISLRVFSCSQEVLDEIQDGAQTREALVGELICNNTALVNFGHQRKERKKKSMQQSIFQRLLMKTGHLASLQWIC